MRNVSSVIEVGFGCVKLKEKIEGGPLNSLVYFSAPVNKIVGSTYNSENIRIWSGKDYRFLSIICKHDKEVYQVLKWDKETILSCSEDGFLLSYSILSKYPYYRVNKRLLFDGNGIIRLLKLRMDLLLCITRKDLFLVKYSSGAVIMELSSEYVAVTTTPVLSKKYNNCFFLNSRDENKTILLINYEINELKKVFMNHDKTEIYSLSSFLDSKNEEILICGGLEKKLYVYNTSRKNQSVDFIQTISIEYYCCSMLLLYPKADFKFVYLVAGDYYGFLSIFRISSSTSSTSECTVFSDLQILRKKIHGDQICQISLTNCSEKNSISCISISDDSSFQIFRIKNLGEYVCSDEDFYLPEFYENFEKPEVICEESEESNQEEEGEEEGETDVSKIPVDKRNEITGEFDVRLLESTINSILESSLYNDNNNNNSKASECEEQKKKSKNIVFTSSKNVKNSKIIPKKRNKKNKKLAGFESFFRRQTERLEKSKNSPFFLTKNTPGPSKYSPSKYIYERTDHSKNPLKSTKKTIPFPSKKRKF